MSEEQKKDGLFNPPKTSEGNLTISFQEQNLIKSIVSLIQHEVNIAIDEKLEPVNERVQDLENDMITNESFSDAFNDEVYNHDMATKDDLNDVISDKFDQLLDELKITRS